ncbi:class I SAM-dependent methyltransferase [Flexithrix dorotheae]|uniref:class I SAM-dependent methyltransferase n=1 Tax=Flexithrix dorotheae TaxID=70993 RepID=UPI0003794A53|nr:class I SAM-dependent methyltransferase [Flexithrix dorotheae]
MHQLNETILQFIEKHLNDDLNQLALNAQKYKDIPIPFIISQINGRLKAKKKLPFLLEYSKILYPKKISMEQCSSEITGRYKAQLYKGNKMIDLTGGFGIDCLFFAEKFKEVHYVERDKELCEIMRHNSQILGIDNILVNHSNSETVLDKNTEDFDLIYVDPARRDEHKSKIVNFQDCQPNILEIRRKLLKQGSKILIKASPLLDIKLAIDQLENVSVIHVISIKNDCKELLFELANQECLAPTIRCVNFIDKENFMAFETKLNAEKNATVEYSLPEKYLFEPNASIMKAGLFRSVSQNLNLKKLHPNSHLYTFNKFRENLPGRVFEIENTFNFNKKDLKRLQKLKKAHIKARNFPLSVQQIRKKTGLQEGGEVYLFATTTLNNELIVIESKKMM